MPLHPNGLTSGLYQRKCCRWYSCWPHEDVSLPSMYVSFQWRIFPMLYCLYPLAPRSIFSSMKVPCIGSRSTPYLLKYLGLRVRNWLSKSGYNKVGRYARQECMIWWWHTGRIGKILRWSKYYHFSSLLSLRIANRVILRASFWESKEYLDLDFTHLTRIFVYFI